MVPPNGAPKMVPLQNTLVMNFGDLNLVTHWKWPNDWWDVGVDEKFPHVTSFVQESRQYWESYHYTDDEMKTKRTAFSPFLA
jgi:hypothetical protein